MLQISLIQMFGIGAALAGGLLLGAGRERQKALSLNGQLAGIRSFTIVALIGAIAAVLGNVAIAVAGVGVVTLAAVSQWHGQDRDRGLATQLALLATFFLGALAQTNLPLAAALFVALAGLLQSKTALHRFTSQILSEDELNDVLLLAASCLIVLPLLPDTTIDPWDVLNPRRLWWFAILVMGINAAGYVALRALGAGRGLILAGLLGGFVSSSATIAGMGQRARSEPQVLPACVAAALLSCVATLVQLSAIILAVAPALARAMAWPLGGAGMTALAVAGFFVHRGRHAADAPPDAVRGRPFALGTALTFTALVAGSLIVAHLLRAGWGESGVLAAGAAAGLADVHAAAVSLAQQVWTADISMQQAVRALTVAFTANSVVKCGAASIGGLAFARAVVMGVLAINLVFVGLVLLAG